MREWFRRLFAVEDSIIDGLIAQNAAHTSSRSKSDMREVDWQKVARAGQRNWQDVLRGQRRSAKDGDLFRRRA